jgi:putative ABC transport system permease protein
MVQSYFKSIWRNISKHKFYAGLNILGLALGLSAFLLLLEYISFEKSVNQFHANLPNMYRLINEGVDGKTWAQVAPGWAVEAKKRFPEVKSYCRFEEGVSKGVVKVNSKSADVYRETNIGYVEGNFFEFFSFPLKFGDVKALAKPNVVFISEATAKKYFGDKDAIGQSLELANQFGSLTYTVEGVYLNMTQQSDIYFDMVFSLETLANPANLNDNGWAALNNYESQYINTYFTLNENANIKTVETKLAALYDELKKDKDGVKFRLQAFSNVHLGTSLDDTYETFGNLKYVYMLGLIAGLIILIAWFNYINLSTANAFKRANEVGVRKVIGATRMNLIFLFIGESLFLNILGLTLAIVLVVLLQPFFNELVGLKLSLSTLGFSSIWIFGLGLLFIGSLLSGAYTAIILSKFKPVDTLKGKINKTVKGVWLRKSLVVAQFAISIILMIVTILIYSQLKYMQGKDLGFNAHQLLVIRGAEVGKDSTYKMRKTAFIDQVAQQGFVKDYCLSASIPSGWYNFSTSGFTQPSSKKGDELKTYNFSLIGDRFLNTYQIKLVSGRNFTNTECKVEWNANSKVMINETAMRALGFSDAETAVRTKIQWDERALEIIGVVKDYHHTSLQRAIDPIIYYPQENSTYISIRLTDEKMQEKVETLGKLYKTQFAGNPFEYFFIDESYQKAYVSEQQYSNIFATAAVWAIVIACLGLFGLVTYTIETRVKEIGVRKVLGATISSIVTLLSKEFLILVFIAFVIASPIAWYLMNQWLQDFPYRITISWQIFLAVAVVALLIALFTIGFKAIKAAISNPVKSLRTE